MSIQTREIVHYSETAIGNPQPVAVGYPRRFEGPEHREAVLLGAGAVGRLVELGKENTHLRNENTTEHEAARTDELTGLPNLKAFMEFYDKHSREGDISGYTLMHLDIDFFKALNDSIGYEAGDEVLKAIGTVFGRLFNRVRKEEMIARIGGDEFAVFVRTVPSEENGRRNLKLTPQQVVDGFKKRIRNEFRDKVALPIEKPLDGAEPKLGISIGSAEYQKDISLAEWKKLASKSMKADKATRKAGR